MGKFRDRRNARKAARQQKKDDKRASKTAAKVAKADAKTARKMAKFDLRAAKADSRNKALGNVGGKLVEVGGGLAGQLLGRKQNQNGVQTRSASANSGGGFIAWLKGLFSKN